MKNNCVCDDDGRCGNHYGRNNNSMIMAATHSSNLIASCFKASVPSKPSCPNAALPILWKLLVPRIDFIPSVMAEPKVLVLEKTLVVGVGGDGGGDVKPSLLMAPKSYATGCFTLLVLVKAADETEAKYANMIKTNEVRIVLQFILDVCRVAPSKVKSSVPC